MDEEEKTTPVPVSSEADKMQINVPKKSKLLPILLIILGVLVITALGWYFRSDIKAEYNKIMDKDAETPTTTATAGTATVDPTAGWKTYENTTYGYSVKYPTDWTKGVLEESATFNSPENETIKNSGTGNESYEPNIIIQTVSSLAEFTKFNNTDKTLDSFIRNDTSNSQITLTTLDGEKAYKYLTGGIGDPYYQIAAEHDSKVYWIHFSPGELSATQEKIISTFKFSDPTTGWKTYSDTAAKFTFKYPSDWTVSDDTTKALDATATIQFSQGIEFILTISQFASIGRVNGVSGATSLQGYIVKSGTYYTANSSSTSTVGNLDVVRVDRQSATIPGQDILFISNQKVYRLVFNETNSSYSPTIPNLLISTFQATS